MAEYIEVFPEEEQPFLARGVYVDSFELLKQPKNYKSKEGSGMWTAIHFMRKDSTDGIIAVISKVLRTEINRIAGSDLSPKSFGDKHQRQLAVALEGFQISCCKSSRGIHLGLDASLLPEGEELEQLFVSIDTDGQIRFYKEK